MAKDYPIPEIDDKDEDDFTAWANESFDLAKVNVYPGK